MLLGAVGPAPAHRLRQRLEPDAGARASARQREMTVRVALGASRRRLIRQLLTESLLLALTAGVVGTALAYAGLPAILALVPPDTIPDESEIALNMPVLLFALAISALTSIICGLAPALHTAGRDLSNAMREASRSLAGGSRQAITRKALVVAEIALSLVLLAGSSVLLRTFVDLGRVDLGVSPDRLLVFRVPLAPQRYPDATRRTAFFKELLPRIGSTPGVEAVAVNSGLHPLGNMWMPAEVAGYPAVSVRWRRTTSARAIRRRSASGWPRDACSPTATSNQPSVSPSSTSDSCACEFPIVRRLGSGQAVAAQGSAV